jgi:hypothetical protein
MTCQTYPGVLVKSRDPRSATRWQVMGQHSPGTATAQQNEDAAEDLTLGGCLGAAARCGLGHEMFDQVSFFSP